MKIAIVTQGDKASGAEIVTAELYEHIKENVIVLSGSNPVLNFFNKRNFPTKNIPGLIPLNRSSLKLKTLLHIFGSFIRLRKEILTNRPDYIHVYNLASLLYLSIALFGRLHNYKIILHVHDFYSKDRLLKPISRLLKNIPNFIIPVSGSVKIDLINLGFNESRIHCIHNGIKTNLTPKEDNYENPDHVTIGFVGSLTRWKGLHVLLAAANLLEEQGYSFNYVIVGGFDESGYKEEVLNLCNSLKKSHIKFLGKRNDAREIMKSFDLLVHCSIEPDPFPTVLLEGMHLGCPVVGPNCGGVPEIIDDKQTGLLFETNSKESLSKAILELANDRDLRQQLAANALTKAKKKLNLNRFRSEFFEYTGIDR